MMALFLVLINSLHCSRVLNRRKNFRFGTGTSEMAKRKKEQKQFVVHFSNQFHYTTLYVTGVGKEKEACN
jgi:hypothetical protein